MNKESDKSLCVWPNQKPTIVKVNPLESDDERPPQSLTGKKINSLIKAKTILELNNNNDTSNNSQCIIIAFSIIREGANPYSPGGNHTITILNTTED